MKEISTNSFSVGIQVFRHENPYYDDSYAVNTANIGPYGDAINDELIPYIDETFNTIAAPYGMCVETALARVLSKSRLQLMLGTSTDIF